jgi:hypothetical protein
MTGLFERLVRLAARRPGPVLLAVSAVAAVGAALALTLSPSAATETLVGRSSSSYEATERYRERFGDHAIAVLVQGELPQLVLTDNLGRLLALEGCLAGKGPAGRPAPGGRGSPCDELSRTKPVAVVYGPGTFINSAVGEVQSQLQVRSQATAKEAEKAANAARKLARGQELLLEEFEPAQIRGDADRLQQLVLILLDNALKFTPQNGTVTVRVDQGDALTTVSVVDTGVGVPADQLDRIWDRFHQADSSTRRQFGGTGLGLAIVRHLVELHGGTVHAESDGEGRGATFRVELPLDASAH